MSVSDADKFVPREPLEAKGEVGIQINGEMRILRFSLNAQARLLQVMSLETIEQIPELMRKLDSLIFGQMVACMLVPEHEMPLEELLEANVPMQPGSKALIAAINLATWGSRDGPPLDEIAPEIKNDATPGASPRH
jgi:hypothetical protein